MEHPALKGRGCLKRLGAGVEVDRCENGMDQSPETASARPIFFQAGTDYHPNVGIDMRWMKLPGIIPRLIFGSLLVACCGVRQGRDGLSR
jgi:hypothetical protein